MGRQLLIDKGLTASPRLLPLALDREPGSLEITWLEAEPETPDCCRVPITTARATPEESGLWFPLLTGQSRRHSGDLK